MTKIEYLHQCLQEELAEVIQASSKCVRFGAHGKDPEAEKGSPDNSKHLEFELCDVIAIVELLVEEGEIDAHWKHQHFINLKKERIEKNVKQS